MFFLFFYEASISLTYSVEYFSKKNQPKFFYLVYIFIRLEKQQQQNSGWENANILNI